MGVRYCGTCIEFAVSWDSVDESAGPLATVERESTQALFGLHLASAHALADAPEAIPGCESCHLLSSYAATHGEDYVTPGGCAETAGQLLRQHLLGHLLPQVPRPA